MRVALEVVCAVLRVGAVLACACVLWRVCTGTQGRAAVFMTAGPDIGVAVTKRAGRASSHTQTVRLPPLELLVLVLGLALTLHVRVVALSL